jgi:hypothetical protein
MLDLKKLVENRRSVRNETTHGKLILIDPVDDEVEEIRVHKLGLAFN